MKVGRDRKYTPAFREAAIKQVLFAADLDPRRRAETLTLTEAGYLANQVVELTRAS